MACEAVAYEVLPGPLKAYWSGMSFLTSANTTTSSLTLLSPYVVLITLKRETKWRPTEVIAIHSGSYLSLIHI